MSEVSAILGLPYLQPAQAQKHVTHNEALRRLDLLVQLAVADRGRTAPPAEATLGARHIVGDGATGSWAGFDRQIAVFENGAWQFIAPQPGWRAEILDQGSSAVFDGTDWVVKSSEELDRLGINAVSDPTNRLSVAAPATLLSHEGADHQLKINKAADTDTASLLFQTDWSGRAELGTAGSDAFGIKVSADGAAWKNALTVDPQTGICRMPQGLALDGPLTGNAVQTSFTDPAAGRLLKNGAWGLGGEIRDASADAAGMPTRFVRFANDGSGPDTGWWMGFHLARVLDKEALQIGIRGSRASDVPRLSFRHRDGAGEWAKWHEVYGQRNILGTVGQSGGIPTGAVIERGSNANGDYVRFADGTQICSHSGFDLQQADNAKVQSDWTFPAAFSGAPVVSGIVDAGITQPNIAIPLSRLGILLWSSSGNDTKIARLSIQDIGGAGFTEGNRVRVRLTAIGHWF